MDSIVILVENSVAISQLSLSNNSANRQNHPPAYDPFLFQNANHCPHLYFIPGDRTLAFIPICTTLYRRVVYAKQPFFGPKQVIEYLGRYTHKVAISNHRIKSVENGRVTFSWKDYRHGDVQKLNFDPELCPHCKTGHFNTVSSWRARAPPADAVHRAAINATASKLSL